MIIDYIIFGISISVISWLFAIICSSFLSKTGYYEKLSNLNFIRDKTLNEILGINGFKWIVKNTFFKYFNQAIKLEHKSVDLHKIRHEMTVAEVNHLIGFVFVVIFAVYKGITISLLFGMIIMLMNVLMNLYPVLLQQENKRRLDKLIQRQKRISAV